MRAMLWTEGRSAHPQYLSGERIRKMEKDKRFDQGDGKEDKKKLIPKLNNDKLKEVRIFPITSKQSLNTLGHWSNPET